MKYEGFSIVWPFYCLITIEGINTVPTLQTVKLRRRENKSESVMCGRVLSLYQQRGMCCDGNPQALSSAVAESLDKPLRRQ